MGTELLPQPLYKRIVKDASFTKKVSVLKTSGDLTHEKIAKWQNGKAGKI
jgi:hypothetical protein